MLRNTVLAVLLVSASFGVVEGIKLDSGAGLRAHHVARQNFHFAVEKRGSTLFSRSMPTGTTQVTDGASAPGLVSAAMPQAPSGLPVTATPAASGDDAQPAKSANEDKAVIATINSKLNGILKGITEIAEHATKQDNLIPVPAVTPRPGFCAPFALSCRVLIFYPLIFCRNASFSNRAGS